MNREELNKQLDEKLEQGRTYRNMQPMEARATSEDSSEKIVEGYATTFNEPYLLYDFGDCRVFEQVDAHAFDECDMTDVILQYDHQGRVFARKSNGTLELTIDEHGLHTRANLGGTELGGQLYEEIKGGYTNKMSFGFRVSEDKQEIEEDYDNNITTVYRTITKISKLYDVSAVSLPANDATEISARNFCDGVIEEIKAERQRAEERKAQMKKIEILSQY